MSNPIPLSVPEAAELLGTSRWMVYRKVSAGEIKATKIGKTIVIERDDLTAYLNLRASKRAAQAKAERDLARQVRAS